MTNENSNGDDTQQIRQHTGCITTLLGLIWTVLLCIFVLLAWGCDMAPRAPRPSIDTVRVSRLSCDRCEPTYLLHVQLDRNLGWQGSYLTAPHHTTWPDTLHLPDDPSVKGFTEPQIVFALRTPARPLGFVVQLGPYDTYTISAP
jgi:hypothetical protein